MESITLIDRDYNSYFRVARALEVRVQDFQPVDG